VISDLPVSRPRRSPARGQHIHVEAIEGQRRYPLADFPTRPVRHAEAERSPALIRPPPRARSSWPAAADGRCYAVSKARG